MFLVLAALGALVTSPALQGKSAAPTHSSALPPTRPVAPALRPYISCKLPGGPDLLQTTPLPQAPMARAAQTLTGPKKITMVDGVFAAFGFSPGVPFANVKIEQLPAASYSTEKADLIGEFDAINAKGENTQRNYGLQSTLNGFEIYGFDRTSLDPRAQLLGMYLFFDNTHRIETTVYFLNAAPGQRRFNTAQEYSGLREGFINAYTVCVRRALEGAPAGLVGKKSAMASRPGKHLSKRP